jgi:hypothetical protein
VPENQPRPDLVLALDDVDVGPAHRRRGNSDNCLPGPGRGSAVSSSIARSLMPLNTTAFILCMLSSASVDRPRWAIKRG